MIHELKITIDYIKCSHIAIYSIIIRLHRGSLFATHGGKIIRYRFYLIEYVITVYSRNILRATDHIFPSSILLLLSKSISWVLLLICYSMIIGMPTIYGFRIGKRIHCFLL